MNQFLAAGAAFLVALALLGLGKKPKRLFIARPSEYFGLESSSLVLPSNGSESKQSDINQEKVSFDCPKTSKERCFLQKKLKKLISSNPEDRLLAVELASEWGDFSAIPILRLGLRDMDSRVVKRAAKGIDQFRGRSIKTISKKKSVRQPLNVSLMR